MVPSQPSSVNPVLIITVYTTERVLKQLNIDLFG